MCVGALVHVGIGTLVSGATELKSRAAVFTVRGGGLPGLAHRFGVLSSVREPECQVRQEFQTTSQSRGRAERKSHCASLSGER